MNIHDLEMLALTSHNGGLKEVDSSSGSLAEYERSLEIRVVDRINQIKMRDRDGVILVADLGCWVGTAAMEIGKIDGVAAFGVDNSRMYNASNGLQKERLIVADLNDMPQISDNTFDYLISFNALSYTNPEKSFPELFRVVKPGGIADLDLEFWLEQYVSTLRSLDILPHISVVSVLSGFRSDFEGYLRYLRQLKSEIGQDRKKYGHFMCECDQVRFEVRKPQA